MTLDCVRLTKTKNFQPDKVITTLKVRCPLVFPLNQGFYALYHLTGASPRCKSNPLGTNLKLAFLTEFRVEEATPEVVKSLALDT